jgi:hypothetical protein
MSYLGWGSRLAAATVYVALALPSPQAVAADDLFQKVLAAWNAHDPDKVAALVYTRRGVRGRDPWREKPWDRGNPEIRQAELR